MPPLEANPSTDGYTIVEPIQPTQSVPFLRGDELRSAFAPQVIIIEESSTNASGNNDLPSGVVTHSASAGVAE